MSQTLLTYCYNKDYVIDEEVDKHFEDACRTVTVQKLSSEVKKDLSIVFTPLHGTAQVSLPKLLKEEDKSLSDDILAIFNSTKNVNIREKAIEYFTKIEG